MPLDAQVIRAGFAIVERRADHLTRYFFTHLFAHHPELRPLFPSGLDDQRDRLFAALSQLVARLDEPEQLTAYLTALGRGHRKFLVRREHYPAVGASLVAAMRQCSGHSWSPHLERTWTDAYAMVSQAMIDAAERIAAAVPAWWEAEVLARRRAAPDVVVLTLAPDRPYPYRAGQYLGVCSPRLPQIWRPYSIADAPRADGTLELHVRRIPGGLLSTLLVDALMPGERLRLGPPAGDAVLDHDADRPLLAVACGTGWAQIRALVEQLAEDGGRPATVLLAARSPADHYDRAAVERLAARHHWLRVLPVSPDPGAGRAEASGLLRRRLRDHGSCADLDIRLSGPPDLVPGLLGQLLDQGADPGLIRYDPVPTARRGRALTCPEHFLEPAEVPWIHPTELG